MSLVGATALGVELIISFHVLVSGVLEDARIEVCMYDESSSYSS